MRPLINLYETYTEALHAVQELEASSIGSSSITLIALNGHSRQDSAVDGDGVPVKGTDGAARHFRGQFFSELDLFDLDEIGLVVGGGWLMQSAVQQQKSRRNRPPEAKVEVISDQLKAAGLTPEMAKTYIEGIRRGYALLGVNALEPAVAETAQRVMREDHKPLDHMRGHHFSSPMNAKLIDEKGMSKNRLLAMLIGAPR